MIALLMAWLWFTWPTTEPAPEAPCQEAGIFLERSLDHLEIHVAVQWLGFYSGPRPWPGNSDSLILIVDGHGKEGHRDSCNVPLDVAATVWGITVDQAGNRSCPSEFFLLNPLAGRPMPPAWPFQRP